MNNRDRFEAAWRKEYPLHGTTTFQRSGFNPDAYVNTRVQDGWLMWQAALLSASKPADQRNDCRAHLWALVDIWDDQDNEPEARCYIDGAFKQQIDDARTFLAAFPAASPAAPAQSGEPVYQIEQSNGSWLDVSKVAYQSTEDYRRRIVYAAPQPAQTAQSDDASQFGIDDCIAALVDAKTLAEKFSARNQLDLAIKRKIAAEIPEQSTVVLDDERAAFEWPPLPALPNQGFYAFDQALFTEHQMQGYANAYGEAVRAASPQPVEQTERALTDEQVIAIEAAISISADIEADCHDGSFLSAESVQALRDLLAAQPESGENHE